MAFFCMHMCPKWLWKSLSNDPHKIQKHVYTQKTHLGVIEFYNMWWNVFSTPSASQYSFPFQNLNWDCRSHTIFSHHSYSMLKKYLILKRSGIREIWSLLQVTSLIIFVSVALVMDKSSLNFIERALCQAWEESYSRKYVYHLPSTPSLSKWIHLYSTWITLCKLSF